MKKIPALLITVFVVCFVTLKSQVQFPMPGAVWHYEIEHYPNMAPPTFTNTAVAYTHDTLFMGRNAAVIYADFYRACSPERGNSLFYTSNDSVYFYNNRTMGQWQLLYNFSAAAGQSWEAHLQDLNGTDTIITLVDSVRYTVINSVSLKTLYVTYTEINHYPITRIYHSVIYERIGDMNYLFNFYPDIYSLCDFGDEYRGVLCYSDSTFPLYQPDSLKGCNYSFVGLPAAVQKSDRIDIWPNPFANEITIDRHDVATIVTCSLSDITGRILREIKTGETQIRIDTEQLPAGFYFVTVDGHTKKMLKTAP